MPSTSRPPEEAAAIKRGLADFIARTCDDMMLASLQGRAWTAPTPDTPPMPSGLRDTLEGAGWRVDHDRATSPTLRNSYLTATWAAGEFSVVLAGGTNQWDAWGIGIGRTRYATDLLAMHATRVALAAQIGALEAEFGKPRIP